MNHATPGRTRALAGAVLLALWSAGVCAYDIFDFDDWMQRIDDSSQDLQRHIAARNAGAAQVNARELAELYGLMETFFEKRENALEAVRYAREGKEFAQRAVKDLDARRFVAARRSALAIAHGCRDCHYQYKPL
jgi:hypothetical protein